MRPSRALAGGLLLAAAAAMRLWNLPSLDRGFYQDEAVSGLMARDLLRGTATAREYAPRMMFPAWTASVAPFVGGLGATPLAVRLPAALWGILAVILALALGRRLAGPLGGFASAGFLAFSTWHLIYSRSGTAPVLVVAQGLALGLLLTARPGRPVRNGALAGLVAGSGFLSYYAGWSLVPALALAVLVRARGDAGFRAEWGLFARGAFGGLAAAAAAVVLLFPEGTFLGGTRAGLAPAPFLAGLGRNLAALFVPHPPDISPEYWGVYPPGAPFLAPVEAALVLLGLTTLVSGGPARWRALMAACWVVAGLAPAAALAEGYRFSRAIGALAPLAMLAGLSAGRLAGWFPRLAPALVAAAVLSSAVHGGWRNFGMYERDLRVRVWSNAIEVDAAQYLRQRAETTPLILINAESRLAVLDFFLSDDIARGRVSFAVNPRPASVFETVFRDPIRRQPALFLFRCPGMDRAGAEALILLNTDGLLNSARVAEAGGKWGLAAARYREALGMFPDLAVARLRLARALERSGDRAGARQEREAARRLGLSGNP